MSKREEVGAMTDDYSPALIKHCLAALNSVVSCPLPGDMDHRLVRAILDAVHYEEMADALCHVLLNHDAGGITMAAARQMREAVAKHEGIAHPSTIRGSLDEIGNKPLSAGQERQ